MNMNVSYFPIICHHGLSCKPFFVSNSEKMRFIVGVHFSFELVFHVRSSSLWKCDWFNIESKVDVVQILRFHKKTLKRQSCKILNLSCVLEVNVPVKHKWQRARSPSEISGSLKTGETVAEVCMNRLSFLVMFTPNQREQFFNFVILCGNKQKRRRCRDVKPDGSRSGRRLCIVNCVVFVLVITCFSSRRDALILSNKSAVWFFSKLTFFDEVSCLVNPPHQTLGSGSLVIVPIARYLKFMLVFTELFP